MASENPLTEYLEKKAAGYGQAFGQAAKAVMAPKNLAGSIVGAGAAALGAGAVAAVGMAGHAIYDAATKSRDFKAMLAENDDLQELHQSDPRKVNRMFSTLRTFAPEFSSDPTVAGAYVRQMVDNPMGVNGLINGALDSRHKMLGGGTHAPQGIGSAMLQGAQKGMASPGGGKPFKDPVGFMRTNKPVRRQGVGGFGEVGEELGRSNERVQAMRAQEAQEGTGEGSPRPFKDRSQAWEAAAAQRSGPKAHFSR
jgi:hypothetical protein